MNFKTTLFFLIILTAFTSCKTYEVKHFKTSELDKVGDLSKYKVYLHANKNLFKVTKPTISGGGVSGDIEYIKDHIEAEEVRNPGTPHLLKKHSHDLNIFTKNEVADSLTMTNIKKADITEYSLEVAHSHVNWDKVGNVVAGVFGVAVCLVVLGALIYWFSFI